MNYEQLLQKLSTDLPSQQQPIFPNSMWFWIFIAVIVVGFIAALFMVFPLYNVWASRKNGEARLAEANYAEQIAIAEAEARLNAAHKNREAEEIEALAVANSISTIGKSLEENEGYLRWQWIKRLGDSASDIIYVPTEANLPILEASRGKSPSGEIIK